MTNHYEPLGWVQTDCIGNAEFAVLRLTKGPHKDCTPVYASPTVPEASRKPMTAPEIAMAYRATQGQSLREGMDASRVTAMVRAVEAWHGIKP